MNISKLTLTPLVSKAPNIVIEKPATEIAAVLIKEKLTSKYGFQKPARPRMPKFLKGFVNPNTYVGRAIDTYKKLKKNFFPGFLIIERTKLWQKYNPQLENHYLRF